MIYNDILEAMGNTPLIRLRSMADADSAEILVKFEGLNVGGSIKTRTAFNMICDAEKKGLINKDTVIVEPTSGNQGIGLALVGAVLTVLTSGRSSKNISGKLGGGLYGLYNTASGYLGDILSYSRLLALGLSTGVIATVINLLGTMPGNKIAKLILFIGVFLLGHTANIAINLIGTYVHTNRLQYVEFFSKFYEGGGRSFTPLKADTKHFRFKEEIQ